MDANIDTELKGSARLGIGAAGFNFKFKYKLGNYMSDNINLIMHSWFFCFNKKVKKVGGGGSTI